MPRRQRSIVERRKFIGSLRLDHPDQAGAVAGQGHLCERPGLGVEFGRNEAMSAAVREIEHQRRLRIRTRRSRDARRLARRRQAPVGGDGKRALDAGSVGQPRLYAVRTDCPAIYHCAPPVDARPRRHSRLKRGVQVAIGDVQPEMILGDLRGAEGDDRAADQPPCRIDDPHHLERRGLGLQARPECPAHRVAQVPASSMPWCADPRTREAARPASLACRGPQAQWRRSDRPARCPQR